jgi:hypothetical protein
MRTSAATGKTAATTGSAGFSPGPWGWATAAGALLPGTMHVPPCPWSHGTAPTAWTRRNKRDDQIEPPWRLLRRVGEDVAVLAPHRPGRADFPHPVPHARASFQLAYRCMILARGSGWRLRNALKRVHVNRFPRVRRSNHLRHVFMASWRYCSSRWKFPVMP